MKAPLRTFIIAVFLFSAPFLAYASTRAELLSKIEELRETVRVLTTELRRQLAETSENFRFDRNLTIGSRGTDVERLQLFLSLYTQFYPEGFVTGYYGELTNAAVERFKREYDINEFAFGDKSRESMNDLLSRASTFVVSTPSLTEVSNGDGEGGTVSRDQISTDEIALSIHSEINRIREENGLSALIWDEELARVALSHTNDQVRDNKGLTDPGLLCQYPTIRHEGFVNGHLVRDRVESANIPFRSVGENIAMIPAIETRSYSFAVDGETPECPERTTFVIGRTTDETAYRESLNSLLEESHAVEQVTFIREDYYEMNDIIRLAVEGWMNSPGHKENILYPGYTHGGVGVAKVNEYYIITHDLVGR